MSIEDTCKSMAHDVEQHMTGAIPCAHAASGGMCSFCAIHLREENRRLREALDWFVSEAERAKKKGYDLTELALERCLANGKEALGGK